MNKTNFAIVLLLSAILGSTAIAFSFARESRLESEDDRDKLPAVTLTSLGEGHPTLADDEALEAEVIRATPNGFEPAVITRPRGPFILGVQNQSGTGELVLRLARTQGEQLQEVRLRTGRRRHHQRFDLPPGEYILSEASRPRWRCQITITR